MSNSDLWMRDIITSYGVVTFIFILTVIWIHQRWSDLQRSIFKSYLTGFEVECAELTAPYRKHLFELLENMISNDGLLRSMDCIRLLEIGVKTGENIPFYPDNTHLIGVDRNVRLAEYLMKGSRSWQFSHIIIERLIVGDGSHLEDVPTGCVDAVVTTRSLCSVTSIESTLREILRVLSRGGLYLFIEHVPESERTFVGWLQKVLSQSRIWPSFFGGCHLDVNLIGYIKNAGFERVTWDTFTLDSDTSLSFHFTLTRHHVIGIAIR
ncbi:thiol S-methyltransferase TMT1A-like isoform X2 [Calliopsis andreniformis]|uniref:thiol S-methyltransferase TMT1A-like isoform X2 n=1 Tax=Calliopsis andreniformis TaxID=337506 RepID=UPI003FCC51F8